MTMIGWLVIRLDGYFWPGPKGLAILINKGRLERAAYNGLAIEGRLLRNSYIGLARSGWLEQAGYNGLANFGWG